MHFKRIGSRIFILSLFSFLNVYSAVVYALTDLPIELEDGTEVTVQRFAADGDTLLLWLTSSAGMQEAYQHIASQTAEQGMEVWLVDLLEAHFLPLANSSVYQIPASDIRRLTERASQSKQRIFWYSEGAAAIPVLRGLRDWQIHHKDSMVAGENPLGGVILNSPNVLQETPDPGETGLIMPIARRTNLPILLLQPTLSPRFWQLTETISALQQGGSDVFVWLLREVRGRFHFRPDAVERERQVTQSLPVILKNSTALLRSVAGKVRSADTGELAEPQINAGKKARELLPFHGNPQPPALELTGLDGSSYNIQQLKGRVLLINFWTTWCPPCVHEMPSLQLLSEQFNPEQFLVLGVNMAESVDTIHQFLTQKVTVDFPILLDRDGAALKRWQVYAFPTTYVLDRAGKIRFALFGSIQWDTPEIIGKIKLLVEE